MHREERGQKGYFFVLRSLWTYYCFSKEAPGQNTLEQTKRQLKTSEILTKSIISVQNLLYLDLEVSPKEPLTVKVNDKERKTNQMLLKNI